MITKTELLMYRELIEEVLADLAAQDAAGAEDQAVVTLDQQSVGRLNRMDALQRQAMAQATARRRQGHKAALLAALRRLDEGEFGYCLDCGEVIPHARLQQNPAVTLCIDCAP